MQPLGLGTSVLRRGVMLSFTAAMIVAAARADCPELNRLPADTSNGQLSISGGVSPNGARAADDFLLPMGNGNPYNVRVIKAVLISNVALSPENVSITIYNDSVSGSPPRPHPGTTAATAPNSLPTIRDLGPLGVNAVDGRPFRTYELTYSIPPGFLQLAANRWYWLAPYVIGAPWMPGAGDEAYVSLNAPGAIVGESLNYSSAATPGGPFLNWQDSASGCCVGTRDLGLFVDAVQVGRPAADVTCDFVLTVSDIFEFLNLWFAGSPIGDFDGVGGLTVGDIFAFLDGWFAGT